MMARAGGRRGLGLGALPDSPVPAIAASAGPRVLGILAVFPALAGLAIVVSFAVWGAAPPLNLFGLAGQDTARVADKYVWLNGARHPECPKVDYVVEWADRRGEFTVCTDDLPAGNLEVGDEVVIESVPWSSEVSPVGTDVSYLWLLAGLVSGIWLSWLGVTWIVRYRRLVRGSAKGVRLAGVVTKQDQMSVSVVLSTHGFEGRRMVLLPVKRSIVVTESDPVEIWSSRRSLVTHNPGGPWVLRSRGFEAAYTHAWLRREKK